MMSQWGLVVQNCYNIAMLYNKAPQLYNYMLLVVILYNMYSLSAYISISLGQCF